MRKLIIAALFALTLAGCATTGQYGNFVPAAANQQQIATDAVQQLATLYPPAKTRFELHQATPDAFGLALVNTLRAPAGAPAALPLRYVLDQAGTTNLYRLTLLVGNQSITRPYLEENGSFVPAGYWARKE